MAQAMAASVSERCEHKRNAPKRLYQFMSEICAVAVRWTCMRCWYLCKRERLVLEIH